MYKMVEGEIKGCGGRRRKKELHSQIGWIKTKELDDDFIIGGFIATTHLDSGFPDGTGNLIRDRIDKQTLELWANEMNEGVPRANKVTIRHDRDDPIVAGAAIRGSAKIMELQDGEFGLYVDSNLDQTHDDFSVTKHRLDVGTYDSFSIEFTIDEESYTTINHEDYIERHLLPSSELHGYTIASRPMNEHAVRIKESNKEKKEDNVKMVEQEILEKEKEKKEEEEITEEVPQEEEKQEESKMEEDTQSISKKEFDRFQKFINMEQMQKKEEERKELRKDMMKEIKEEFKAIEVQNKAQLNTSKDILESKEMTEYKEMFNKDAGYSVNEMFKKAGKIADKMGLANSNEMFTKVSRRTDFSKFEIKNNKLSFKGLGLTTNQNTDTDYLLSSAELADIFDPVIYTALNQSTVTWNILAKDDFSTKGNNQVQFTVKTAANTTAAAYTGNAVSLGNATRLKVMTKFKKYAVGVQVDGDMIAAARGGPLGDVFAEEVRESTIDMMSVINQALFAEVGLETAAGVIGFEYISDSAGNTTLYSLTRSSTTLSANVFLSPSSAADTYINGSSQDITLANLRGAKRQALKEGANIGNLVFVTDHIQGDKFRGIYDAAQRSMPTSSRFGFEGRPEFDGVPIFEDKDCNDDDWWLVDLETHRVAIWVPPTLEMLGKDSDSEKGFIKTYFATYNRYPRRLVQIYANATS